jgi:hypothetical protein
MKLISLFLLLITAPAFAQASIPAMTCPGDACPNGPNPAIVSVPYLGDTRPDVIPIAPMNCPEDYKLQRYHELTAEEMKSIVQTSYMPIPPQPSGWYDMDAGPHDGDYRCIRAHPQHAGPVGNPIPGENMKFGSQTTPAGDSANDYVAPTAWDRNP